MILETIRSVESWITLDILKVPICNSHSNKKQERLVKHDGWIKNIMCACSQFQQELHFSNYGKGFRLEIEHRCQKKCIILERVWCVYGVSIALWLFGVFFVLNFNCI